MLLPSTETMLPAPVIVMPSPPLRAMVFPSPAAGPPIVTPVADETATPALKLPRAAVAAASRPTMEPRTAAFEAVARISIPWPPLPDTSIRSAGPLDPMTASTPATVIPLPVLEFATDPAAPVPT